MNKLIKSLVSFSLIVFPVFADYSSLTKEETRIVKTAFEQAKFYKYYQILLKGADKVKITNIKKLDKIKNKDSTHLIYLIKVDLIIDDVTFKREFEFSFDIDAQSGFWSNKIVQVISVVGWVAIIIVIIL